MQHKTAQTRVQQVAVWSGRVWLLALMLATGLAIPAQAQAGCTEAIFSCKRLGGIDAETGLPVERSANLRSLRAGGRNDAWIGRNCRLVYSDPDGCSWRGGGGGGGSAPSYGGGPSAPPASYGPPSGGDDGDSSPAPRRDAWGRRSPTPAPRSDEVGAPEASAPVPDIRADSGPYSAEIAAAAGRYKLPAALIRAVLTVESGGHVGAVSHKGARGLMQLMPATAKALGVDDPADPAQNIMGGARFLRILANKFQGDLVKVLSAYHAGSLRVLTRDATPFAATDAYVRKVLRVYYQLRDQTRPS